MTFNSKEVAAFYSRTNIIINSADSTNLRLANITIEV